MSTNYTEMLAYVYISHTQRYISQETGIPASTLSYVLSGTRELPETYYQSTIQLYQREVATRLFEAGGSQHQAERFSYLEPTAALEKEEWIMDLADKLTLGSVVRQLSSQDIEESDYQSWVDDNYAHIYGSVVESMQRSEKPFEEWEDYA